jgi:hypothetical protein
MRLISFACADGGLGWTDDIVTSIEQKKAEPIGDPASVGDFTTQVFLK